MRMFRHITSYLESIYTVSPAGTYMRSLTVVIIGLCNGLMPVWNKDIICINVDLLSIGPLSIISS